MNYSYSDQLMIIKAIRVNDGERKTLACPFCGGPNKFTIGKIDGKLLWNCYRASCGAKGIYSGKRTPEEVKLFLENKNKKTFDRKAFPIPSMTTSPKNSPETLKYLEQVNSLEAYVGGLIRVRYAPKEKRVLFYTKDGLGAVGRSLGGWGAKWCAYGDVSGGMHVGTGQHAVLVEDVASACSVSNVSGLVGVALLGTNITKDIASTLSKYTKVTLVLDMDARKKSLSLLRKNSVLDCTKFTKDDLKYLSKESILRLVE